MAFPDSSKKAPNVFLDSIDGTGSPNATGSVSASNGVIVYNLPPSNLPGKPTNVVASLRDTTVNILEYLNLNPVSIVGGEIKEYEFVTSVLYPIIFEDNLSIHVPSISRMILMSTVTDALSVSTPTISSGALNTTINYASYSYGKDNVQINAPIISSGALTTTVAYTSYSYGNDNVQINAPTISGGALTVTINYLTYNNWPTEHLTINLPSITSGTLA